MAKIHSGTKNTLTQTLIKLLEGKKTRISNQIDTAKQAECIFTHANNDEHMLSISDRLDILQTVLPILIKEYSMPNKIVPEKFKQYYIEQVNMYRNRLSHITLGEKTIHIKGRDVEINQDLHRLLRKNISEVDSTIQRLEQYLTDQI